MANGIRFRVFANLYKDSVALMQVGAALRKRPGIDEASCLMATPANLEQLEHANLTVDAELHPSDLLVVVRGEASACEEAINAAPSLLEGSSASQDEASGGAFSVPVTSIAAALEHQPDADLALISVPGDYAAAEAMKALSSGLHVMLFSDNVGIDEERTIKRHAEDRRLLVMGPDCGTAIINGIPLGFANVVRRGGIGLVAASGTGLQEVTCRIHNLGGGVSQAIGTGGRDLHAEIGGSTMRAGIRALAEDDGTHVIVLISKPPAAGIAAQVLEVAKASGKPTIVHFLGAAPETIRGANLRVAQSLAEAADMAVAIASEHARANTSGAGRTSEPRPPKDRSDRRSIASSSESTDLFDGLAPTQRLVRALFTGGTFCYEAQLAFLARGLRCRSNAPAPRALPLDGTATDHVLIDMGDDEYTRGRPHPMIDPSLRNAAIEDAAREAVVGILLFDVVLGFGSHPSPADELASALSNAQRTAATHGRRIVAIGHVCGTDGDPQDRAAQIRTLESAGAHIVDSNIEAAYLSADGAVMLAQRAKAETA